MANALYKGDLAEVSFGKETGLRCDGATWTLTSSTSSTSTITVGTGAYWHTGSGTDVEIPDNILVGCVAKITGGTNFSADDYATTRRSYYITANDTTAGTITVQPALATSASQAAGSSDNLLIESYQCPTFDSSMSDATNGQKVRTDQFIGLLNEFAVPEPQIDVRKQHVIGMGRDVNVITSGRETLDGGSLEVNAHTMRWLKYALGGHTARGNGSLATLAAGSHTISEKLFNVGGDGSKTGRAELQSASGTAGDYTAIGGTGTTFTGLDSLSTTSGTNFMIGAKVASTSSTNVTLTSKTVFAVTSGTAAGVLKVNSSGTTKYASYTAISSNDVQGIADIDSGAAALALVQNKCVVLMPPLAGAASIGDTLLNVGATVRAMFSVGDYVQIIDKSTHQIPGQDGTPPTIFKHEIRRVIAVGGDYLHLEEGLLYAHAVADCGIDRLRYTADATKGSPNINATTKELQNGVTHTFFGHNTLPSFTIEQSLRNSDATPGGEQLLRLYSGCKVGSATITADTEGELKISCDYQAARNYTDTGSKFAPHRMFDNTANTSANRKVSGIAVDGEKPYLFQDISIEIFGRPVLRATSFSVSVSNTNTARWFIRGYEGASNDSDQVQHGATQTPMDITEGAREYTFTFKALVEDDRLWEELRTRRHHQNTNDITFTMTKPGSATTRQTATITIEDYTIMKADHQIPSDKGPIEADVELVVRHMKVTENNPYFIL
tara:strand:- start:433 stop:2604 length:2172 start_codon:yes stop_codon:yes gene_type:complete